MLYLKDHGISYTFVKRTKDYNIPVYKYKKTPELFRAVADFYEQQEMAKTFDSFDAVLEHSTPVSALTEG